MLRKTAVEKLLALGGIRICRQGEQKIVLKSGEHKGSVSLETGEIRASGDEMREMLEDIVNPTELTVFKPKTWTKADDSKLETLLSNYRKLFEDAVGYEKLEISDLTLTFVGLDPRSEAHQLLVSYLQRGTMKAKKFVKREADTENPRFTMRTLLVRLGWTGKETKKQRISIYEKLAGNSAFRYELTHEEWKKRRA